MVCTWYPAVTAAKFVTSCYTTLSHPSMSAPNKSASVVDMYDDTGEVDQQLAYRGDYRPFLLICSNSVLPKSALGASGGVDAGLCACAVVTATSVAANTAVRIDSLMIDLRCRSGRRRNPALRHLFGNGNPPDRRRKPGNHTSRAGDLLLHLLLLVTKWPPHHWL